MAVAVVRRNTDRGGRAAARVRDPAISGHGRSGRL